MIAHLRRIPKTIWLVLGVALAIIIPFLLFGDAIEAWFADLARPEAGTARGAFGAILFGLLALDVLLPVPSSLASTLCGVVFGLWGGFWLSFGAMTVSAALGYWLGRACSSASARTPSCASSSAATAPPPSWPCAPCPSWPRHPSSSPGWAEWT